MIAAGKLDRLVSIERAHRTTGYAGAETVAWSNVATVRAELIEAEIVETKEARGVRSAETLTFRLRFVALTSDDRLIYEGRAFNIVRVREIGRRRGLELQVVAKP